MSWLMVFISGFSTVVFLFILLALDRLQGKAALRPVQKTRSKR